MLPKVWSQRQSPIMIIDDQSTVWATCVWRQGASRQAHHENPSPDRTSVETTCLSRPTSLRFVRDNRLFWRDSGVMDVPRGPPSRYCSRIRDIHLEVADVGRIAGGRVEPLPRCHEVTHAGDLWYQEARAHDEADEGEGDEGRQCLGPRQHSPGCLSARETT